MIERGVQVIGRHAKRLAAGIGSAATAAMVIGGAACAGPGPISAYLSSADSATTTVYFPPTVPQMTTSNVAMNTGQTITQSAATTTPEVMAHPTVGTAGGATCANNGAVLPASACH